MTHPTNTYTCDLIHTLVFTDPQKTAARAQPQVFRRHLLQTDVCHWGGSLVSFPHTLVAKPKSTLSTQAVTANKTCGWIAMDYRFVCLP